MPKSKMKIERKQNKKWRRWKNTQQSKRVTILNVINFLLKASVMQDEMKVYRSEAHTKEQNNLWGGYLWHFIFYII